MKIKKIKINSYGKINNKNIELNKINIIYGKNESGKSTILNFIISMFYNISKNKNGKNISDYDKYTPWNSDEFSGNIEYELDNNETFYVYRNFNKKNPEIYNANGEDISGNFGIDKKSGSTFFSDQVMIDRDTLLSTVINSQNETKLDLGMQNLLIQKVANLADSGNEDISYKKAVGKLDKILLTEVGTEKSQDRPINIARENIMLCEKELDNLHNAKSHKYKIEEEINELKNRLKDKKHNQEIYDELNTFLINDKNEEEKIKLRKDIINENNKKIEKYKNEKIELEKNNLEKYEIKNIDKNKKINLIILFFIILINLIINIFIKNNLILKIIIFSLIPIWIIFNLLKNKINNFSLKNNNKILEKNNLDNLNLQIELLNKNNNEIQEEINLINKNIQENQRTQKDKLTNKYGNIIEELLDNKNIENITKENKQEIDNLNLELHKLEIDMEYLEPQLEKIIDLEEKLSIENENLEKLENSSRICNITKQMLEEAYNEMKSNITPKFNKDLSENIAKLSNGKYTKIILDDGIYVELDNGRHISIENLSVGTIEQIYLAFRLSVIDGISKESMPLLLDETFAFYDNERLEATLQTLCNVNNQLIIFTCTNREKEALDKLKIPYNYCEL